MGFFGVWLCLIAAAIAVQAVTVWPFWPALGWLVVAGVLGRGGWELCQRDR